jgi:hypothetical protein
MEGWRYDDSELFYCSCGQSLDRCPLITIIADAFRVGGLPFAPNDFGTSYRLSNNERLNRYLTGRMPFVHTNYIEKLRDTIVAQIPMFSRTISRCDRANLTFIQNALSFSGAAVFVDATKNPYRLRYLRRLKEVDLNVLYLIRDFRGVVLSFMENRRLDATDAAKMWIREQVDILRILSEFPAFIKIHYEDLCETADETLSGIHRFAGLSPARFSGDFKGVDHHILGNVMRLGDATEIVKSTRWRTELSTKEIRNITDIALAYVKRNNTHPLADILNYYVK